MTHGIILHEEYRERMKKLSPERLGKLVRNMFLVDDGEEPISFTDDEALDVLSEVVCGRLQRDIAKSDRQRENGSKGGAPKGNQNARKQTEDKPKTTQKQPKNNPKQTPITNNQLPITNKDIKRPYGECANVFLTDDEYSKITHEGLTGLIEELSLYIASKGDKYRSHYAVIKQWANRRKKEQAEKTVLKPNQFTQGVMRTEIDFSDLEKRLIKN
jgi:hypothetical protein